MLKSKEILKHNLELIFRNMISISNVLAELNCIQYVEMYFVTAIKNWHCGRFKDGFFFIPEHQLIDLSSFPKIQATISDELLLTVMTICKFRYNTIQEKFAEIDNKGYPIALTFAERQIVLVTEVEYLVTDLYEIYQDEIKEKSTSTKSNKNA